MPHSPVRTPHSPVRPVFGRFAGDPYHESEYNLRIETPRRRSRSLSKRLSGGHTPPADGPAEGITSVRNRSNSPTTAPRGEWHETPASLDELQVRHRELALLAAECERQKDDLVLRQEYLSNFRKQLAEEDVLLNGKQSELQQRAAELVAKEAALREREALIEARIAGCADVGAVKTDAMRTDWQTADSVDDLTVSSCSTMPTVMGRPSGVEDATVVSMPPPSARYGPIGPLREALAHAENKADFWERKWMQLMREVQERDEIRLSAAAVAVQVDLQAEEQQLRQAAFQQWHQGCEARKAAWQAEEKHWEDRLQYLQNVVRATEIESKSGPPTPTPRPLSPVELRSSFDVPSPVGLPPATPPPRSARIARGASPSPRFSTGSYYGSPRVGAAERGKSVGPDALLNILIDLDIPHFSGGTQDPKLEKKVEKQKKKIEKRIAKDRKKQEENARKEAKEELKLLQKSARGGREHGVRLE